MDHKKIDQLMIFLNLGKTVGWYNQGEIFIIKRIEDISDEMRGIGSDGKYIDLWNVEPDCMVVVESAFKS